MKAKTIILVIALLCTAIVAGCKSEETTPYPESVSAVLVGIGYKCDKKELRKTGSDLDISTMAELLNGMYVLPPYTQHGYELFVLQDSDATLLNVTNTLKRALTSELAIIYFSCRATQIQADDLTEEDNLDECLMLYDGLLVDNDIWKILGQAHGRVFIIFDTGHSESMFRLSSTELDKIISDEVEELASKKSRSILLDLYDDVIKGPNLNLNMICWSACLDNEDIDERSVGSRLTNAIYFKTENWDTYEEAYDKVRSAISKKQTMIKTTIGEDFKDKTLFR